jgi:hypothetical protein
LPPDEQKAVSAQHLAEVARLGLEKSSALIERSATQHFFAARQITGNLADVIADPILRHAHILDFTQCFPKPIDASGQPD